MNMLTKVLQFMEKKFWGEIFYLMILKNYSFNLYEIYRDYLVGYKKFKY